MKFIRKPIVIDAISFEDFIQHGRDSGAVINNGMPWSFTYSGRPVSHETDDHYLITLSSGGTVHFTKDTMLVNDGVNALYVLSKKDFDSVFVQESDTFQFDDNALRQVLTAFAGHTHHVLELYVTRNLPDSPINTLTKQWNDRANRQSVTESKTELDEQDGNTSL